jgi:hypothetical protein
MAPQLCADFKLDLAELIGQSRPARASIYNPWKDLWSKSSLQGFKVSLPPFTRSLVVRVVLE